MRIPNTHVRWISLAAAGSLLLAGCQSANSRGDAQDGTDSQAAESTTKLTVATPQAIPTLDAFNSVGNSGVTANYAIFDTPIKRVGESYEPGLASSWENPDPLTWVLTLREDVKFHSGATLTAQDVVASLERLAFTENTSASNWRQLESVEATDDYEVTLKTTEPMVTMLASLSLAFIVGPKDEIDQPDYFQRPNGTGPFKVDSFVANDRLSVVRNDDYYGDDVVPSAIDFVFLPEASSRVSALITGEVDFTWGVGPDQLPALQSDDDITITTEPSWSFYITLINQNEPPFDDVRVRRALRHAVDLETIQESLFGDAASIATAPISQTIYGYAEQDPYDYDPELARELLAEAGYPNGFESTLKWEQGGGINLDSLASALVSDWAEVGITLEPIQQERATWVDDVIGLNFDLVMDQQDNLTGDADNSLNRLFACSAGRVPMPCHEELDTALANAQSEFDEERRLDYLAQAQSILWDEVMAYYPLELTMSYAMRNDVTGFAPEGDGTPNFTTLSRP